MKKNALIEEEIVTEGYAEYFARRLREALGEMSQAELIKLLAQNGFEMTQQRLSHYMQGRNYPDPPVLKELARALDVSADWLLGLTEQSLPAADLDEMAANANGEGRINKVMRNLPLDKQQQVLQFAEYLLSRHRAMPDAARNGDADEARRISREATKWLDSIEKKHGLAARQEVEKLFRDKNLIVDDSAA